jgi:hypothetical protein
MMLKNNNTKQHATHRKRQKKNQETQRETRKDETKYNEDDGEEKKIKHPAKREIKGNRRQILEGNEAPPPRKQHEEGNKTQQTDIQQNKAKHNKTEQKKVNPNKTKSNTGQ